MARKGQIALQDTVETNEDFEAYIESHHNQLIVMEVYSDFCGSCAALAAAFKKAKMEIGLDSVAMLKACADKIDALKRFQYKSEPCVLFVQNGMITRIMFGANGIELCRLVELELDIMNKGIDVPKYHIDETLPVEDEKMEVYRMLDAEQKEAEQRIKMLTLAARKKRVCDRMSTELKRLNYIMYWPHCHQAHYDLYEKLDSNGLSVVAKDTFQLTEETVKEALYMSDVEPNEACVHGLITGLALVACFKMNDYDNRDIVKVMRHILYEEIPVPNEDLPPEKQLPPIPAYERYASISKTAREVRRDRYNAKMELLRIEQEQRDRLASEQARLARQAEEERQAAIKQKAEEERMARIQQGLPADPEPEPEPEELEGEGEEEEEGGGAPTETESEFPMSEPEPEPEPEKEEVFHSDVEIEGEDYIPPGGLFVPGIYCPPNEYAKVNGLSLFFPKVVSTYTEIESEVLPPHVLLMFSVDKRNDVNEIVNTYKDEILNIGIFKGDDPQNAEHVAYTVKQYNKMTRLAKHHDRVAVMVSRKRSLPLLQLAGLNPCYISGDADAGERDCLKLFPVGYADDYVEEESVQEEEVPEIVPIKSETTTEVYVEEEEEEEEEEED